MQNGLYQHLRKNPSRRSIQNLLGTCSVAGDQKTCEGSQSTFIVSDATCISFLMPVLVVRHVFMFIAC